jgi:hypothetical protein
MHQVKKDLTIMNKQVNTPILGNCTQSLLDGVRAYEKGENVDLTSLFNAYFKFLGNFEFIDPSLRHYFNEM